MKLLIGLLCLIHITLGSAAAASEVVGFVKTAAGTTSVTREGVVLPITMGDKLFQKDTLETGNDGSLAIILRDDTTMSMGPDSRIVIESFIFAPKKGRFSNITKMTKGIVAYISGKTVSLAPGKTRFKTPMGMIGIRGTRFLVKIK